MQTQSSQEQQPQYNIKLVHATRPQTMNEAVDLVFALNDGEQEQVVTASIPVDQLFALCQQEGWVQKRSTQLGIRSLGRKIA